MAEYGEVYDESDLEGDFEDLEGGDSRRRRRRRGGWGGRRRPSVPTAGPAWQRPRPPSSSPTAALRREAEAGRARDRQLARAVNTTKEDIGDVEGQLRKANSDVARLRQLSLISLLLPRRLELQRQTLVRNNAGDVFMRAPLPADPPNTTVVTGVSSPLDILPVIMYMMMARGIGTPGRADSSTSGMGGDNSMMLIVLVLLMQQQQQAGAGGAAPGTTTGGLDTTMLLLVMLASGGLS